MELNSASSSSALSPPTSASQSSIRPAAKPSTSHSPYYPPQPRQASEGSYGTLGNNPPSSGGQPAGPTGRSTAPAVPPPPPLTSSFADAAETEAPAWTTPAAAETTPLTPPIVRNGMYPSTRRRVVPTTTGFGGSARAATDGSATAQTAPPMEYTASGEGGTGVSSAHAFPSRAAAHSPASSFPGGQRMHPQQRQTQVYQESYARDAGQQQGRHHPTFLSRGGDGEGDAAYYEEGADRRFQQQQQQQQQQYAPRSPATASSGGGGSRGYAAYPPPSGDYAQPEADSAEADAASQAAYYQQYCQQYYQYQAYYQRQQQQPPTSAASGGNHHGNNGVASYGYAQASTAAAGGNESYPGSESGGMVAAGPADAATSPSVPPFGATYAHRGMSRGRSYYSDYGEGNQNNNIGNNNNNSSTDTPAYSPHAGTSAGRGGMRYGVQSNAANDFFTRVTGSAGGVGEAEQQQQHHRTASRADSANGSTLASSTDALVGYAGGGGPHSTSSGGYPSPHQAQAGYSADYDAAATQQFHNAYGDQTMAGGYRDYYNAGGGYTYNSGYYANAQHQRQPQQQQQPYQRDGGGARGTYGQSSYGSYGYTAPYHEPYRNYPSAGGTSSNARRGYQQPHQPQHQQQQYAEQDAYAGVEEMHQGNAYWQPKPPPPPPHQQGGGTPQYAEGVPELYATSPAEEEEASAATRTQTTFAGAVPKAGAASAAAAGNTATTPVAGESKSAIRKRKKAAAAAAAAAAALVASSGATEEPPRVSSAPLTTAQKRAAAPPPLSKAAWKVPPPAAAERGAEGATKSLQASSAADDAPSRSSAAQYETRFSTQDPLISLERTASAERRPAYARPPQYVAPTGVNSERASLINVGGASAAAALKEGDARKGTSAVEAKDAPLRATTCRDVSSKRLAAVETMTTTPPTSNSSSGDSGNSSSGDLGRTSNGSGEAHGRSSSYVHGNSPGGTQRFLRHSPLTQCVGAPFHTYLNGAMVGQAAQLQTLPPSAATATAAAAAAAASGATGAAAMASSTASVSTSSSQVIPAFYAPVQRLLAREVQPHRTISTTNTAGPGETSGRHRGASQLSDGNNAAAEAEAEAEAEESGSGLAMETGVVEGIGHVEADGDAGDDGSGEHGVRGFPRQPQQRSATASGTLSNELLGAASEASALRPTTSVGAATASSPSSSPRSAAGIHPHHMHLFAHHSAQQHQQQRPDSARAAMLPQHLHAYRHSSPSLQPVALAATASTGSDPCVQSPGSAASLPPRSPAGAGASAESAGAGMAPVSPPLRARGAGMAGKQASVSNHATPTASAPHAHMTTAAVGSGAASTMHYAKQQQQHLYQQAPTHPSSPRTCAPAVGGAGYVDTVGADAADGDAVEEAGRAHDGIGKSGGSAYAAAGTPQHQQAQYGGSGSGRRSSLGAYRPSPSSPSMSVSAGANTGGSFASPPSSSSRPVPPAIGTLTPMAEQQLLPGAQSIGPHTSSSTSANVAGAAAYNTPSPRSGQQGSYSGAGGSSAHANSPQRGRYSPRHPFAGAGNTGGANTAAAHPNNGFQAVLQQPAYIYEHHTGQEVLLEEFHAAMGFNAQSFGNIACLVDAFAPSVPIASDLEFPCDEEQCQLLQLPEVVGSGSGAEEAGLCSPLAAPGAGSSASNGSAFCSRDGGPSLHLEDTALPSMLKPPPRPSEVDRGHYWDFSGPSYCEPVLTLKSIWQSFDSPFGCVVNLAEPIFPAPMRPAEDELVYTPLLSGFRIRFHPASPSYKRLAALREVRRQRRREEGRADGSDGGGGGGGRDGALAEADGVLTWSAADRPNNRNIIFEQVNELARCDESYAELLTATTADVDHQSWVALMWQPVFCGGHSAKHSCGTFLAFYLLRAPRHLFVPFASKSEGAAMNSSWSSPVFRGDRAALSFDLWSLQRHYHVARWVSSPPMTHVTTALSVAGEEDEDASSISASRGRLSWEDGAAGYASNAAESFSVSNHGEGRARLRDVTSQSFAEAAAGTSAASYVRLPLVGLIPNRCRSEVWFKAIYDANTAINAHPGANPNNGSSNGNAGGGDPFFFHAPLFLIVTALQLMCWDAYNEWRHKSAPVLPNSAESRETAGGEAASVPGNADGGGGSAAQRISNEPAELENPLTHLMEEEMSAAVQQRVKSGETERSHVDGQERVEEGERGGENRPNPTTAGSSAWVAYFAEGVEVMTDAARRYRQVREQANLDALPEDGGAALQPSATAATPVARAGAESPALTSRAPASGDSEEKKAFAAAAVAVEEGAVVRSGATALVAGGTNSALCDTEARVIAGLLDYYQWAQYDSALSGLARLYCTT